MEVSALIRRDTRELALSLSVSLSVSVSLSLSHWGHSKKVPICKPGRPHQNLTILASWSWISSLQNCEKINVCCWSHPVYGIWSWQPKQTNTVLLLTPSINIFLKKINYNSYFWRTTPKAVDCLRTWSLGANPSGYHISKSSQKSSKVKIGMLPKGQHAHKKQAHGIFQNLRSTSQLQAEEPTSSQRHMPPH